MKLDVSFQTLLLFVHFIIIYLHVTVCSWQNLICVLTCMDNYYAIFSFCPRQGFYVPVHSRNYHLYAVCFPFCALFVVMYTAMLLLGCGTELIYISFLSQTTWICVIFIIWLQLLVEKRLGGGGRCRCGGTTEYWPKLWYMTISSRK